MTERVGARFLALFVAIYAVQGVVFAYFMNSVQPYMAAAGVAEGTIGVVQSVVMVPFILKFLAGPLSDRFSLFGLGHRVPYIVLGLLVQAVALFGLSLVDPGRSLWGFGAVAFTAVLGMALYDTCGDGLMVEVTPPADRSRVQGLATAARFLAATICTLGFGYWLRLTGNGPGRGYRVLWTCAALGLVPLALALISRRPSRVESKELFSWSALKVLLRPRSLVLLAFGGLYALAGYGVEINLEPYYRRGLNLDAWDVGLLASARNVGRAVGAMLLPLAIGKVGRRRALIGGLLGLALATAGQAAAGRGSAGALGFAFGVANGWDDALFFVLAMEASDPRMAASTYALFMAASNVSVAGGGLFSTAVDAFDGQYRPVFLLASVLGLIALPLVPALVRPPSKPEPLDV